MRDFLYPSDFYKLVSVLFSAPAANAAVDCYSHVPIDKPNLLGAMQAKFGLRYGTAEATFGFNAMDSKAHYYSLNICAANFGYQPAPIFHWR